MIFALLLACEPDDIDTGDSAPVEEIDYPESETCDVLEIYQDGEDPPKVGDVWTIFLKCDGTTMLGASVVALDPTSAATNDDNVITWAEAGPATISLQTGRFKTTRDVTVLPPE